MDNLLISEIILYCFIHIDAPTDTELRDFLDEITLMKSIGFHKNVISFIGCNTMLKPRFLVLEYMPNGDLLHYLRKRRLKVSMTI